MKLSRLSRAVHRWGALLIAVPAVVVILTGVILQLKKEVAWVQPPTQRGSSKEPTLLFDQIITATKAVPEAAVKTWDDIDRLDVRPGKGVVKVRCRNRWEIQLDSTTGDVLQVAYRRSDFIESIHDGSYFHELAKLWVFFPAAIVFAILWITGIYLFFLPYLAKRKRARQKRLNAAANSSANK